MSLLAGIGGAPGSVCMRADAPSPPGYVVFDCETTGTTPGLDEIVSFSAMRLDADGVEAGRFTRLVRPARSIPAEATAVHGIADQDVASAPRFGEVASDLLEFLDGAVFVAHNAPFDLAMLEHAFALEGVDYCPFGVVCTLDAFRLLEPFADDHRLESICARHGIVLEEAHEAVNDVVATAALLRVLLVEGFAPETIELDHKAFLRLRSRGDTRPATDRQIRRVFGLARSAGLLRSSGGVDRAQVVALGQLAQRVCGNSDVDSLSREQVQDVYDELEQLIAALPARRAA